jgi:hypothetical protein
MHPSARQIYQTRMRTATFAGALGQFLRPYEDFADAEDLVQGTGGLRVSESTSRKTKIVVTSNLGLAITQFAAANAARTSVPLQETPRCLFNMREGVKINGKPWVVGTSCFFNNQKFGVVTKMIYWKDSFATTLILELARHTLHYDGYDFWVDNDADLRPTTIFWNQLTHRCKMYPSDREPLGTMQAVVKVSTTQPLMDGIDFDLYMRQ